jgi:hypothetical protein
MPNVEAYRRQDYSKGFPAKVHYRGVLFWKDIDGRCKETLGYCQLICYEGLQLDKSKLFDFCQLAVMQV